MNRSAIERAIDTESLGKPGWAASKIPVGFSGGPALSSCLVVFDDLTGP